MTPWLSDPDVTLYHGDCLEVLRELPSGSVHMCATSPPFYGLRDYGTGEWEGGDRDCDHEPDRTSPSSTLEGGKTTQGMARVMPSPCLKCGARRVDRQIGLEETPDQWVERLVAVFREVRRVLRDDGTLWVEIGDSYATTMFSYNYRDKGSYQRKSPVEHPVWEGTKLESFKSRSGKAKAVQQMPAMKPKDLIGQPWLLAFALRADGWWLRSEIIWARPNPMPESVTDRPTKSHSTVFLLSKQPRYFYDADAIREAADYGRREWTGERRADGGAQSYRSAHDASRQPEARGGYSVNGGDPSAGRNARSVWTIPTEPTPFAHFATWPQALVRRMILAGTSERGCCPECGAPWVRETETEVDHVQATNNGNPLDPHGRGSTRHQLAGQYRASVSTLGWSPSCVCDVNPLGGSAQLVRAPVPCTVLDPFAGSGTTSLVARNHGRHSIGIELNEEYLRLAATRLQQLSLLA